MSTAALIVAAGRGSRLQASAPKQYLALSGRPILSHTISAFAAIPEIAAVQVVIHPDDADLYASCVRGFGNKLLPPVHGGATRQLSVRLGLEALKAANPDRVLIHDAARPFVPSETIRRVIGALDRAVGAIAALPLVDTLKLATPNGTIAGTAPREHVWRAQTPQGFRYAAILSAHDRAHKAQRSDFTDDAQVAEWAGLDVALVQGSEENFKVTTAEDLVRAEAVVASRIGDVRTGTGFDVHRFREGDHVWLCGVRIAHDRALEGHSDADVGLHALTDAVLGALGDGDIGQHFPPSDPRWKGAPSKLFLEDAARRVAERGGVIANVDVTLLCEAPRIGPHRQAMSQVIAEILKIDPGRVGVKATTTEGLGFTGRREGIAAMAQATVRLP